MLGFPEFSCTFFFLMKIERKKAVPLADFWGHMGKQLAGSL